jgi:hypothetical protein
MTAHLKEKEEKKSAVVNTNTKKIDEAEMMSE